MCPLCHQESGAVLSRSHKHGVHQAAAAELSAQHLQQAVTWRGASSPRLGCGLTRDIFNSPLLIRHVGFLDVLDEEKFMVELVVQCIRSSDVPQTHHHALLLLGTTATIFPVSDVIYCSILQIQAELKSRSAL